MDALALRIQAMEAIVTDMATKMNAYVTKTDGMMTVVETNDTALKATIEAVKGTLDTKISELQASATKTITDAAGIQQAQLQLLSSDFSTSISGMDAKLQFVNDQITKAETAFTGTEQAQEDQRSRTTAMETEVIRMAAEHAEFKKQVAS